MRRAWSGWIVGTVVAGLLGGAVAADPGCCGGGKAVATCVVEPCAIYDKRTAPRLRVNNQTIYFCETRCIAKLKAEPARYLKHSFQDPISGKWFRISASSPKAEREGVLYLFISPQTKAAFDAAPTRYAKP